MNPCARACVCVGACVPPQEVIPLREDDIRRSTHFMDIMRAASAGRPDASTLPDDDDLVVSDAKNARRMAMVLEKKVGGASPTYHPPYPLRIPPFLPLTPFLPNPL
jgi:hypothetical protein